MKRLFFLLLVALVACNKDDDKDEPLVIERVEYRVDINQDGPMIKYLDSKGVEQIDFLKQDSIWVYSFEWEQELDSVGFKLKDYIEWTSYQIIINTDTVVKYIGPVPPGGQNQWYGVYYKF